jgi:hypothetical protein
VANPQKVKGDRAELEIAGLLSDALGFPIRRKLGAGRLDDEGDLAGFPQFTCQVANWASVASAVRIKPLECEQQRINAGTPFAVTLVRLRGGDWRAVLTLDQFTILAREVLS